MRAKLSFQVGHAFTRRFTHTKVTRHRKEKTQIVNAAMTRDIKSISVSFVVEKIKHAFRQRLIIVTERMISTTLFSLSPPSLSQV